MPSPEPLNPVPNLTERRLEILRCVALARSNADVATMLSLSVETVKKHLFRIYRFLGAANRMEAVNMLREWEAEEK
jgi:DNA-binding NarL/FixJ family response regulator